MIQRDLPFSPRPALTGFALVFGCAARIATATSGHNYDLGVWDDTAVRVLNGLSPYRDYGPFCYGPTAAFVFAAAKYTGNVMGGCGISCFHLMVAAFLTACDAAIALLVLKDFGVACFLCYFLNPVSILLTGYHSQLEPFCILPAYAAWRLLSSGEGRNDLVRCLIVALLLGFSLSVKHVFFFFPLWLFFRDLKRWWPRGVLLLAVPYIVFLLSFLPWSLEPQSRGDVFSAVFLHYNPFEQEALFGQLTRLIVPDFVLNLIPNAYPVKTLSICCLLLFGLSPAWNRERGNLFGAYLLSITVLSPVMANQYLAIPLIACAIYWRFLPAWLYTFISTLILLGSSANVGSLPAFSWFVHFRPWYYQAQIWLLLLLLQTYTVLPFLLHIRRVRLYGKDAGGDNGHNQKAVNEIGKS